MLRIECAYHLLTKGRIMLPPGRLALCMRALVVLGTSTGRSQEMDEMFFPLKLGSKWTYRSGEEKVVVQVGKAEELEITRDKKKDKVKGFNLKIVTGGRELTDQVAVLPDGVYRFSVAGKPIIPPLCILKFPIKKGATWTIDSVCKDIPFKGTFTCDEAEIAVPAFSNKFRAVTTSFKNEKMSIEYFFAPKFGLVKQRLQAGDYKELLELEKYEP